LPKSWLRPILPCPAKLIMNYKQVNILIILGLFLLFDLAGILMYQTISRSLKTAEETSSELISGYNVQLDEDNIKALALKITPDNTLLANQADQSPEISVQEPSHKSLAERKKEIDLYLYNGNGVAGDANDTAVILVTNGYMVKDIGNADKNDYEKTMISYHSDKQLIVQDLQILLNTLYNDISLKIDDSLDKKIEIILGKPARNTEGGDNSE